MGLCDFEEDAKDILRKVSDTPFHEAWKPIAQELEKSWAKGHDEGFEQSGQSARDGFLQHLKNYIHREENKAESK